MRRLSLFLTLVFASFLTITAQTIQDALRYSTLQYGSTARMTGAGSAMGTLGGDFGAISINPAGLATWRGSEFQGSLGVLNQIIETRLEGRADNQTIRENRFGVPLTNIGLVLASNRRERAWKTINFGLGLNRLNDYRSRTFFEGYSKGSIADRWVEQANAGNFNAFETGLAEEVVAIYKNGPNEPYTNDFANYKGIDVLRNQSIITRGGMNEMSLALAGNYKDRIYAGFSFNVPFVSYNEDKLYKESDPRDSIEYFNQLSYGENLSTSGGGVNFRLGVIARLHQAVRVGVSFQSPTWLSLTDNYSTKMMYDYTDGTGNQKAEAESDEGTFEYRIITPARANAGASFVLGKIGFLSAEAEWIDYANASFDLTAESTNDEDRVFENKLNQSIQQTYRSTINYRIGAEFVLDVFRLRGGYQFYANPFQEDGPGQQFISAGVGIRGESVFFDLGWRRAIGETFYSPYSVNDIRNNQVVNIASRQNLVNMTIGFRF